jgi:hypothetical protein
MGLAHVYVNLDIQSHYDNVIEKFASKSRRLPLR